MEQPVDRAGEAATETVESWATAPDALLPTRQATSQNPAIRVNRLSKRYVIRTKPTGGDSLAARLQEGFYGFLPRRRRTHHSGPTEVWSLQDVSFDVQQGEVVGIVGRNGAGKSTLLKILSRIVDPTSGRAELRGRVGTLLEIGTGFHPELTGRDNIYLSGIILGLTKREIDACFDEIVAFAGIGAYVETPVKRYSSGMFVRLAFAVGAHLEPEILIVDEVLAVGDFEFQSKCLRKMQQIGTHGRTVLFVSHDMSAVSRLCPRSILLDRGRIVIDGPTTDVLAAYLHAGHHPSAGREWRERESAPGNEYVRVRAVRVRDRDGAVVSLVEIREAFTIELEYEVLQPGLKLAPHIGVNTDRGERLFLSYEVNQPWDGQPRKTGRYISRALVPGNLLTEGIYFVGAFCYAYETKEVNIEVPEAIVFQIFDSQQPGGARGYMSGRIPGAIRPLLKWNCQVDPLTTEAGELLSEREANSRR